MNSFFIDSHAHIYLDQFSDSLSNIIKKSHENRVKKILMPNINIDTVKPMLQISRKYEDICYPMLGLHPCYLTVNYESEINQIFKYLDATIVAVGEIGIDLFRSRENYKDQVKAMEMQCEIALDNNLPIVIHTRNSIDETIEIVQRYSKRNLKGVFHCFVGNYNQAKKIIDLGFKLGIGGILTFKNSELRNIISKINLEDILLETDSPYLSPEPYRGKINNPSNLVFIGEKLSQINSLPIDLVCQVTSQNAINLFDLPS
tara:strand:+ start:1059 stop:1835 length:777 start_codon:yes stop_codon:yes gene_type:complete